MRVKLLVVGIIYFICIWIKIGASNKCYRAKICIHDGKEKCGQDLEGNVRRFLDSCDMKEYNCLKHANYVKTNNAICQNLPDIEEKAIAKETANDRNESYRKIKIKGDDTGRKSDESNDSEVKRADSNLETSQENENNATSKTDEADRISEEVGVKKVNEKDKVVEVDVVLVSEENKNSIENKEDRPTGKVKANRDTEQEGEGKSEEDDDNKVSEENKEDGIDRVNNSNGPREDDDYGRINGISVTDSTSKVENGNKNDADQDNNSYRKDDEEKADKLLVENVYDTDEND